MPYIAVLGFPFHSFILSFVLSCRQKGVMFMVSAFEAAQSSLQAFVYGQETASGSRNSQGPNHHGHVHEERGVRQGEVRGKQWATGFVRNEVPPPPPPPPR